MTRINVIPTYELSDQWLLAEYRELSRCIKQNINIKNAPINYCLGKGYMKWARCHITFLLARYKEICNEMTYRGFNVNYPYKNLVNWTYKFVDHLLFHEYTPTASDLSINRNRLIDKYKLKPEFYRWTKRDKPKYITDIT